MKSSWKFLSKSLCPSMHLTRHQGPILIIKPYGKFLLPKLLLHLAHWPSCYNYFSFYRAEKEISFPSVWTLDKFGSLFVWWERKLAPFLSIIFVTYLSQLYQNYFWSNWKKGSSNYPASVTSLYLFRKLYSMMKIH